MPLFFLVIYAFDNNYLNNQRTKIMVKVGKKILITLGVFVFSINVLMAGIPEEGTIIVHQTEQQIKFKVEDQNQTTIAEVVYFKIDASGKIFKLSADYCESNFCNYSFPKQGMSSGIYQIQVYVVGYSEPLTKSIVL